MMRKMIICLCFCIAVNLVGMEKAAHHVVSDESTTQMLNLFAVSAPVHASRDSSFYRAFGLGTHCFLKTTNRTGEYVGSYGFFQSGTEEEPYPHTGEEHFVASITLRQWLQIQEDMDDNRAEHYNLSTNNCCHVVREALRQSDLPIPAQIKRANRVFTSFYSEDAHDAMKRWSLDD